MLRLQIWQVSNKPNRWLGVDDHRDMLSSQYVISIDEHKCVSIIAVTPGKSLSRSTREDVRQRLFYNFSSDPMGMTGATDFTTADLMIILSTIVGFTPKGKVTLSPEKFKKMEDAGII